MGAVERGALLVLALIVAACALAPVYAATISGTDPFRTAILGIVDGKPVMAETSDGLGTAPIGPGWRGPYLLGADALGRDVAARLLYGGRTSLLIGGSATVLCLLAGVTVGVIAGFWGGAVDTVLSAGLDLLWAFPVTLLAISLSIVLIGADGADSLLLPILILAVVYVPYVARPLRARVIALRAADFVEAARSLGASPGRILVRHIVPHLVPDLLALGPIVMAMTLLTEAALSILSIGVQAPHASWGTLMADGQGLVYTRPVVAIAPGVMVIVTVLALNSLGNATRPDRPS